MPRNGHPAKQMKLSVFTSGTGNYHSGGWRHPQSYPDMTINFQRWAEVAQKLEAAKFDMMFVADSAGVTFFDDPDAFERSPYGDRFEPVTLLSGLAAVTKHIGLAATVATQYKPPYDVARQMAS